MVKPTLFYGKQVQDMSLSDAHGCAIYGSGTAACWGWDRGGTFGNSSTSAKTHMEALVGIVLQGKTAIATPFGATCVIGAGAKVWCTGMGGQVGNPAGAQADTTDFVPVLLGDGSQLAGIARIRSTLFRTLALDGAGKAFGWGLSSGFLENWQANRANAIKLPGKAEEIAGGPYHACFLLADGNVWCQGQQTGIFLGDPAAKVVAKPMKVPGLAHIKAIAGGNDHTCAVRADGAVLCWGANDKGQCGNGKTSKYSKPAVVTGSAP